MSARNVVVLAWLLISATLLATALPDIDRLGLYYDEAFMAQQARDFTMPDRVVQHPGSVRSTTLFGRPFPVRNAAYLGSLKSQLVIPAFELFGSSVRVLRTTTLAHALLALLCAMLVAERLFSARVAIVAGVLLASDPSFYFYSQYEWGPFTTNLLCRCLGALLVIAAWQNPAKRRGVGLAIAGGLVLGLGIFSRADFGLVLAAAGLALVATRRDLIVDAWVRRRAQVLCGGAALFVAALPMLTSTLALFTTSSQIADRGDLGFKWQVLLHSLDGTQFLRVMQVGGLFDEAHAASLAGAPFPFLLVLGFGVVAAEAVRARSKGGGDDARPWLLVTLSLVLVGTLLMPGAVRAHHQLNAMPLGHIVVACAGCALFGFDAASPRMRRALQAGAMLAGAVLVVANGALIAKTRAMIDASGGKGRWTNALAPVAHDLDAAPNAVGISLDWGFHEPLLFLTERARLGEAIWSIPQTLRAGRPWVHVGDADTLYLVHPAPYDLFGLGPDFMSAVAALDPNEVEVVTHHDGDGDPAFRTVRIQRRHRLVHTGRFAIQ